MHASTRQAHYGPAHLPSLRAETDSKSPLLYTKRAAAYAGMRQQAQALRDLNAAVELEGGSFTQAWLHRGKLHRQMCK